MKTIKHDKKLITLKNRDKFMLRNICRYPLRRISIQRMWVAWLTQFAGEWFFLIFIWGELNRSGRFTGIPETPELTEMTESFTKVTKYLTKLKKNINKLCLGKISRHKTIRKNFLWIPGFRMSSMVKNENPETPEINRKLYKSKKHPVIMV